MTHNMRLTGGAWRSIAFGAKDIEMRLCDEKRSLMKQGDAVEFVNLDDGRVIFAKISGLHRFENFAMLYSAFSQERLGYLSGENACPADMEKYYSRDDIEKWGVLGIELSDIKLKN